MKHLLVNHLLFLLWSLFCIALGAFLSRRLIITTTELYAAMWHDARESKQFLSQMEGELKKLKDKAGSEIAKIVKP